MKNEPRFELMSEYLNLIHDYFFDNVEPKPSQYEKELADDYKLILENFIFRS